MSGELDVPGRETMHGMALTVAAGEVSEDRVEVAGLLDAIPDARQLIAEVLATGVSGVEVTLDGLRTQGQECQFEFCCREFVVGAWIGCSPCRCRGARRGPGGGGAGRSAYARHPRTERAGGGGRRSGA